MNTLFRTLLVLSFLFIVYAESVAQVPGGGTPSGGTPSCWPPPCIPIDGGISVLLVAGVAIGAKKMYDLRK